MSKSSAGVVLCEPTELYNILTGVRPPSPQVALTPDPLFTPITGRQGPGMFGRHLPGSLWLACPFNCLTLNLKLPPVDVRLKKSYYPEHILLARSAVDDNSKKDDDNFVIPLDVHLPTTRHVIVYDSKTVSIIENSKWMSLTATFTGPKGVLCCYFLTAPAIHFANLLASSGSKNPVMVLKGNEIP